MDISDLPDAVPRDQYERDHLVYSASSAYHIDQYLDTSGSNCLSVLSDRCQSRNYVICRIYPVKSYYRQVFRNTDSSVMKLDTSALSFDASIRETYENLIELTNVWAAAWNEMNARVADISSRIP